MRKIVASKDATEGSLGSEGDLSLVIRKTNKKKKSAPNPKRKVQTKKGNKSIERNEGHQIQIPEN